MKWNKRDLNCPAQSTFAASCGGKHGRTLLVGSGSHTPQDTCGKLHLLSPPLYLCPRRQEPDLTLAYCLCLLGFLLHSLHIGLVLLSVLLF